MPEVLLSARGVAAGYGRRQVLFGVDLDVADGEVVALLGANGSGKSTLLNALSGFVRVSRGSIRLGGMELAGLRPHRVFRAGVVQVSQARDLFAEMTVEENLRLAGFLLPGPERRRQIAAMYGFFPDLARQRALAARRLSGGQRQMLAIARALMVSPRLLMLDEPSAGLSPKLVETVFARLAEIRGSEVAILLVEQNAKAALAIGDRAYVMVEGRERHEGPAAQLRDDPAVARLYLGGAS